MTNNHAGSHAILGTDRVTPESIGAAKSEHTHTGIGGGSVWTSGTGAPSGASGSVGDWYLDDANGDVYEKTGAATWTLRDNLTGPTGVEGPEGPEGPAGPQGISGPQGDPGDPGSVWSSGTGAPSGPSGSVGDWYLNDANGDVYEKTGSVTWTLRDNITGPQGTQGIQGIQGIQGVQGPQAADMTSTFSTSTSAPPADQTMRYNNGTPASVTAIYIDETDSHGIDASGIINYFAAGDLIRITSEANHGLYHVYSITSNTDNGDYHTLAVTWVGGNSSNFSNSTAVAVDMSKKGATGSQGIQGIQGNAGTPGSVWWYGAGAPSGATGVIGDYYHNYSNGDVYTKTGSSTWTQYANITGPAGPAVADGDKGDIVVASSGTSWTLDTGLLGPAASSFGLRKIGTAALEACAGNDSRLSDSRTPTTHVHSSSNYGYPSMSYNSAALSGNVTLTNANTYYDGPSLSLAAGTWLLLAHITFRRAATTLDRYFGRITDKTNHFASSENTQPSQNPHSVNMGLAGVAVLGTTTSIYIQGAAAAGGANSIMAYQQGANASGSTATQLVAVRIV